MTCVKCGDCCKKFRIRTQLGLRQRELVSAHYGKPVEMIFLNVTHRCCHLDENNRCKIYEDRPQTCRDFLCLAAEGKEPHSITLELDG